MAKVFPSLVKHINKWIQEFSKAKMEKYKENHTKVHLGQIVKFRKKILKPDRENDSTYSKQFKISLPFHQKQSQRRVK